MKQRELTRATLARLPRYYRCLRELIGDDTLRVSSEQLARLLSLTASQVRQDFAAIGAEGQQGYGYNVKNLYTVVGDAIGVKRLRRAVIIGDEAGLGEAIARGVASVSRGITLCALFGFPESCAGTRPIADAADFCRENAVEIVILCTSREETPAVVSALEKTGVKGIWNLSGTDIPRRERTVVFDTNLADCIIELSCAISEISGN